MIVVEITMDGVTSTVHIREEDGHAGSQTAEDICTAVQKTATLAVARVSDAISAETKLYGRNNQ